MTAHHDDLAGVIRSHGPEFRVFPARVLASTLMVVGVINALVAGVLAALLAEALGGGDRGPRYGRGGGRAGVRGRPGRRRAAADGSHVAGVVSAVPRPGPNGR